jgi:hypothetical protein
VRTAACVLARRTITMRNSTPLISFTFDDFPRSALHAGGAILLAHGARGSFYASLGLMGKTAPTGEMFDRSDLELLLEQGHELGCHTFAHCNATTTAPDEFEKSMLENARALRQIVPHVCFRSMSYPIGTPLPEIKRRAGRRFDVCRGGGQCFNSGVMDLNLAQAFFLEQSVDRPEIVHRAIEENCRAGGWLIFATHDISEQPTRFGCKPAFFENVVKSSVKSGAAILPVARALEHVNGTAC